jgi:hypothetical protein
MTPESLLNGAGAAKGFDLLMLLEKTKIAACASSYGCSITAC